ncbi:MAG: hypothetical protein M0P43_01630 [Arcobacteraceae bacterium]|jgi:hypothetical protein|nr:hypothetical protein [Arcobacteraceae bacterium]MDY0327865.1 hypothetical protein [Arcobacteraceae bacterium]
MQLTDITNIVVYLVFVGALMIFSLYPAIWISEKLSLKSQLFANNSRTITIILTITFASIASLFLYSSR